MTDERLGMTGDDDTATRQPFAPAVPYLPLLSTEGAIRPATPVIVFTNGCFDLLHPGHVQFLKRCRTLGQRLIVGLNTDDSVRSLKGPSRPILTFLEREAMLLFCGLADQVVPLQDLTPCQLIRDLRPDIIVKGRGYTESAMPEAAAVREYGGQIVLLDGPPISSTQILQRVAEAHRSPTNGVLNCSC